MNAHGCPCATVGVREQHSAASSLRHHVGSNSSLQFGSKSPYLLSHLIHRFPSKILQGSAESGSSAGWSKQIHLCQRLVSHLNSPSLFLVTLPKNKLVISSSKPILSSPISLSLCWEINFKPRMTFDSILSAKVVSFQTVEINHWEPMGDRVSAGEIYGQKGQCWGNYGQEGQCWRSTDGRIKTGGSIEGRLSTGDL